MPAIDAPQPVNDWLATLDTTDNTTLLLDPAGEQSITTIPLTSPAATILVSPEGGFSDTELDYAKKSGVTAVRCGPRILRTETAGFAALSILQALHGDFCR